MRRVWIASGALILLCTGIIWFVSNLMTIGDELLSQTDKLTFAVSSGDWQKSEQVYLELSQYWEDREKMLIALVGHDHTDPVSVSISRIAPAIKQKESSELLIELSELSLHISHLLESEEISLVNMF